jgi:hypothetical protein
VIYDLRRPFAFFFFSSQTFSHAYLFRAEI